AGRRPAVVRGAGLPAAGVRRLLLLGAQRQALPGPADARPRRVVLRARRRPSAPARHPAGRAPGPLPPDRPPGAGPPPPRGAGLPRPGRRLGRALLHAVVVQAAHLRPARLALPRPGPGLLRRADRLGRLPPGPPGGLRQPGAGARGALRRPAVVRPLPLADEPAGRGAGPVRRPLDAGRLLPAQLRLGGVLPRPERPAHL